MVKLNFVGVANPILEQRIGRAPRQPDSPATGESGLSGYRKM